MQNESSSEVTASNINNNLWFFANYSQLAVPSKPILAQKESKKLDKSRVSISERVTSFDAGEKKKKGKGGKRKSGQSVRLISDYSTHTIYQIKIPEIALLLKNTKMIFTQKQEQDRLGKVVTIRPNSNHITTILVASVNEAVFHLVVPDSPCIKLKVTQQVDKDWGENCTYNTACIWLTNSLI